MTDFLDQLEPETRELLSKLLEADARLPREDRGNFLFEERWTRKYGAMFRPEVEKALKNGNTVGLPGGRGSIDSLDQLPPEYDRDIVRHAGLEDSYLEVAKIDIDTLKALGCLEFTPDDRTFSLTPKARAIRTKLESQLTPMTNDIPAYADADQPWFTNLPKIDTVRYDEFMGFQPDVVLLTAVPIERDMVLRSMRPLHDRSLIAKTTAGPDTYYIGIFGKHKVVLVMSDMGAVGRAASILTTADAIRRWNPKAVIAVGIAFGMNPDKQQIADVLVSRTVSN